MARRTKRVASRGSVNNIILESLLSGDKYGYEIIKEVEDKTGGKVKLKQPSLYSSLKRFESKNYIDSYWGDSDIGGRRHYYRITDAGKEYYKRKNTSIFDDDDDFDDVVETANDNQANYEYDNTPDKEVDLSSKYTFSVEDKMKELLGDDGSEVDEQPVEYIAEPDEAEVDIKEPSLRSATKTEINEQSVEQSSTTLQEDDEEELLSEMHEAVDHQDDTIEQVDDNYIPDHIFYSPAPLADSVVDDSQPDEQPQVFNQDSEQSKVEIITDEYGITKLKSDEVNNQHDNRIIDNVNNRINYKDYVIDNTPKYTAPQAKQEALLNDTHSADINYKDKLSGLFNDNEVVNSELQEQVPTYDQPVYNNFAQNLQQEGFTIKSYTKETKSEYKNEYLLVNKLRFVFGVVMALLMLLQTTTTLICVSANGLLFKDQYWIYIAAYVLSLVFAFVQCIPFFVSPNKQSSKSIKLNYALLFGALAFFVALILTYAFNTFAGLDFSNIAHYLSTILVPAVLATNFVVGPIIYYLLTKNKHFY